LEQHENAAKNKIIEDKCDSSKGKPKPKTVMIDYSSSSSSASEIDGK